MQEMKQQKNQVKKAFYQELKNQEEMNRRRITEHKQQNRLNISLNKERHHHHNMQARNEIKDIQR